MSNVSTHIANQRFNDPAHENIVHACLYKITTNPDMLAKSHGMELSDLEQYGYEAFWKACLTYKEEEQKVQFNTYAMNNIKWRIMKLINLNETALVRHPAVEGKRNKSEMHSMDAPLSSGYEDNTTYYDILYKDNSQYDDVVNNHQYNSYIEYVFNSPDLTEREKDIIGYKLNDLSDTEISIQLGLSRQYVNIVRNKIKNKLDKEKIYA